MKKTVLFIDAGYLSHISKHFGNGKHLKYKIEDFSHKICNSFDLNCKEIFFYIAPPFQSPKPTAEENRRKANYDRFIERLKTSQTKIHVREGRLQKINGNYSQKGVDTLITMDLLRISVSKEVEEVVLISSDTDFVPILKEIREKEKIKVNLAYFTDRKRKSAFSLSNHLWKVVDKRILIKKEHFS